MNEDEYQAAVIEKGYADPIQKVWDAGHINHPHTHDVALYLFIQAGEMAVDVETDGHVDRKTCNAGDTIEVPAGVVHTERVSGRGVRFLVAQKK